MFMLIYTRSRNTRLLCGNWPYVISLFAVPVSHLIISEHMRRDILKQNEFIVEDPMGRG